MSDAFRTGLDELAEEVAARHRSHATLSVPLIARTARRRRRRHETLVAAGSVAAVAVLALTASTLGPFSPTPPVNAPTAPPVSPSPSITPTPTTERARVPATKGDPAEPEAWEMTEETWADVGPGWALAVFSTVAVIEEEDSYGRFDPTGTQALFLVAPDDATYRLVGLPADGDASVMWWDPDQRTAWVFFQGLGEEWWWVEVDLVDGDLSHELTGSPDPAPRDLAPVQQQPDGRVLWIDVDPVFGGVDPLYVGPLDGGSVRGLYWQQTDGSFASIPGTTTIEGAVWLDPEADRVVYLSRDGGGVDGLALTSLDLADDATQTTPLSAPAEVSGCSLLDVQDTRLAVVCVTPEPITRAFYEIDAAGGWRSVAETAPSDRLIHEMLVCGAPELPWSAFGRVLPEPLAAQGWRDAWVLPEAAGAPLTVPKARTCDW